MRAPDFWHAPDRPLARALAPLGWAYAAAGGLRRRWAHPFRADIPVICVGNLTTGGAGKTPTALALAAYLGAAGRRPHFLTRGYGGRLAGPVRVDPARHDARQVGDEALLLAAAAPCWVARDRPAGARAAIAAGAEILIMDDGFQNPSLAKDLAVIVVDGGYGFGNGRCLPAGPLREPVAAGLARADAVVLIGADTAGTGAELASGPPIYRARLAPGPEAETLAGRRVLAFAGIGRPEKFFATLSEIGCEIVGARAFPDHHAYDASEIMALCEAAEAAKALPVTTEKDFVRLPQAARPMLRTLSVSLDWADADAPARLLAPILEPAADTDE
ncbi:MAG: tetraacyldisaccharide 4'-kinase [Alphaproteobacteria bacterium]